MELFIYYHLQPKNIPIPFLLFCQKTLKFPTNDIFSNEPNIVRQLVDSEIVLIAGSNNYGKQWTNGFAKDAAKVIALKNIQWYPVDSNNLGIEHPESNCRHYVLIKHLKFIEHSSMTWHLITFKGKKIINYNTDKLWRKKGKRKTTAMKLTFNV